MNNEVKGILFHSLFVIFQEFKLNYVIYVQMKREQTFIFVFCVNPSCRTVTRIYCVYSLQFQILAFSKTITRTIQNTPTHGRGSV